MAIKDWPASERPRERLIADGAQSLSDAELLAVFLRTGVRGKSAVQLARDTVAHFGSLRGLFGASLVSFSAVHGMGRAKFAQLQAVMELARRAIIEDLQEGQALHSPHAVKDYLRLTLGNLAHEAFHVLFLDVKNRLIASQEMFRGTLTHTSVYLITPSLWYIVRAFPSLLYLITASPSKFTTLLPCYCIQAYI